MNSHPQAVETSMRQWMIGLAFVFCALVWPAILAGGGGTSQANDMVDYHAVEIHRLAAGLPAPDLRNSFTSTTPGFHLVLALVDRAGGSLTVLRLVGSLAGLAAWLISFRVVCGWVSCSTAAWLIAPLALSPYVLGSATWMTTDAAALALGSATMGVALLARKTSRTFVLIGVLASATVLVRQILVWCCVPALVRAMTQEVGQPSAPLSRRLIWAGAALIPAVACVAAFMVIWGGSVPPRFQAFHESAGNPAAMVMMLAVGGAWGVFLLPGVITGLGPWSLRRSIFIALAIAAMCSLVRSDYHKVLPADAQLIGTPSGERIGDDRATTQAIDASTPPHAERLVAAHEVGRWGGPLWNVVRATPAVNGRSVVLVFLAGLGGFVACGLYERASRRGHAREATMLLCALAVMAVAQSLNAQTFQRYFDPWVLLALGWLVAMGQGSDSRSDRWCVNGMALLALLQLFMWYRGVFQPAFA